MAKNKNGKVTLDFLAIMIANGFNDVNERFEWVKQEFREIKNILNRHDVRMESIKDVSDVQENSILDLERRVRIIEKEIKIISKKI